MIGGYEKTYTERDIPKNLFTGAPRDQYGSGPVILNPGQCVIWRCTEATDSRMCDEHAASAKADDEQFRKSRSEQQRQHNLSREHRMQDDPELRERNNRLRRESRARKKREAAAR